MLSVGTATAALTALGTKNTTGGMPFGQKNDGCSSHCAVERLRQVSHDSTWKGRTTHSEEATSLGLSVEFWGVFLGVLGCFWPRCVVPGRLRRLDKTRCPARWLDLFHSTMQDMGDQEMKEAQKLAREWCEDEARKASRS